MNPEKTQFHLMRWILFWIFVILFVAIVVFTVLTVFFGVGNPTDAERDLLFKGFLGEIGAAVIALFYAIFGIRRGVSSDSENHALENQTSTLVHQEAATTECFVLSEQVASAGISRFV